VFVKTKPIFIIWGLLLIFLQLIPLPITCLIIIDIFIVGAWFGIERVVPRLENTTLSHESRDEVSLYTLQYWQDYPFFGSGLGSYYTTFPAYQGEDIRLYYEAMPLS